LERTERAGGELPTRAVTPASGGSNSGDLGWGMGRARGLEALGRGGDPIPQLHLRRGRPEGGARRGAEAAAMEVGRRLLIHAQEQAELLWTDYQEVQE
jgi:hypothetical protein